MIDRNEGYHKKNYSNQFSDTSATTPTATDVTLLKRPSGSNTEFVYLQLPKTPLFRYSTFTAKVKAAMPNSNKVGLLQVELFWDNTKIQLQGTSSHSHYDSDWGPTLSCTPAQITTARVAQSRRS